MAVRKSPKPALHSWRVYKVRKKLTEIGMVFAPTQEKAIEVACAEHNIHPFDRKRIIVRQED